MKTSPAKQLALKTSDAYSAGRYGKKQWENCAALLLKCGFTEAQAEQQLRSKNMRWAADDSDGTVGDMYLCFAAMLARNCEQMKAEAQRWIDGD